MIVHVKEDSESGDTIATLKLNPNNLIKHVKEQIEANTCIDKAMQCLLHRFHNGRVEQLWQLHGSGKVSNYYIRDGSILVLRRKRGKHTHIEKVFGQRHGPAAFPSVGRRHGGARGASGTQGMAKQHVAAKQRVAALALSEWNTMSAPLEP